MIHCVDGNRAPLGDGAGPGSANGHAEHLQLLGVVFQGQTGDGNEFPHPAVKSLVGLLAAARGPLGFAVLHLPLGTGGLDCGDQGKIRLKLLRADPIAGQGGENLWAGRFLVNVTPTLQPRELTDLREDRSLSEADCKELGRVGDVKPFSILAHQSRGIDRLGILRMDVDNLGELFQTGFEERATLSRIAGLSSAISLYFEGWVSRVVEEVNHKRGGEGDCIYTIYSGGDDLFFVGAWDVIVELAVRIRTDLTSYAAGHSGIHASGGIVLVGSKYPLAQAAQEAGDAEEMAKKFVWWDATGTKHSKDAISFLDEVLPWSRFGMESECTGNLDTAHGLMHTLVDLTRGNDEEEAAPKAFVRNLIELYEQYAVARKQRRNDQDDLTWGGQEQVLWGPWTWRASYTLHRLYQRTRSAGVLTLEESLRTGDYRMMEWLGVAARWADLYTRREG